MDTFIEEILKETNDLLLSVDGLNVDETDILIYITMRRNIYHSVNTLLGDIIDELSGKEEEDVNEVVTSLLDEVIGLACDQVESEEATAEERMDRDAPAEDEKREAAMDEQTETETPPPTDAAPSPRRGRARRFMASTWKGVRRAARLMVCGCFRGN